MKKCFSDVLSHSQQLSMLAVLMTAIAVIPLTAHFAHATPNVSVTAVPQNGTEKRAFIKDFSSIAPVKPKAAPLRKTASSRSAVRPIMDAGSASAIALKAANYAMAQVGKSYYGGGTGPNGFDCSGLTMMAYRYAGLNIGRTTYEQWNYGQRVSLSALRPGDLVFYYSGIRHVGIYIGNGKIVHAGNYSTGVSIVNVNLMPIVGAVRIA